MSLWDITWARTPCSLSIHSHWGMEKHVQVLFNKTQDISQTLCSLPTMLIFQSVLLICSVLGEDLRNCPAEKLNHGSSFMANLAMEVVDTLSHTNVHVNSPWLFHTKHAEPGQQSLLGWWRAQCSKTAFTVALWPWITSPHSSCRMMHKETNNEKYRKDVMHRK